MIDRSVLVKTVLQRVDKLPTGHYLDLRTYKRNRSVLIVNRGGDDLLVIEEGYFSESFRTDKAGLKGLLKTLIKKEFPRSNKVRLYAMGEYSPEGAAAVERKNI